MFFENKGKGNKLQKLKFLNRNSELMLPEAHSPRVIHAFASKGIPSCFWNVKKDNFIFNLQKPIHRDTTEERTVDEFELIIGPSGPSEKKFAFVDFKIVGDCRIRQIHYISYQPLNRQEFHNMLNALLVACKPCFIFGPLSSTESDKILRNYTKDSWLIRESKSCEGTLVIEKYDSTETKTFRIALTNEGWDILSADDQEVQKNKINAVPKIADQYADSLLAQLNGLEFEGVHLNIENMSVPEDGQRSVNELYSNYGIPDNPPSTLRIK